MAEKDADGGSDVALVDASWWSIERDCDCQRALEGP